MVKTISLKELRPELPKVVANIDEKLERYIITKHGKPVVVMLSVDDYEGLMETLDILSDPETMKRLEEAEEDIRHGRTVSLGELKASLGRV